VTVQRDDGMVARIHLLEITAIKVPHYLDALGKESKWISFAQYNPV